MINLEEYKDNEVFKSLQAVFSDEYIAEQIEAGNIRIEKSAKAGDNESETKQEEKIDKEEKAAVDAEKKVKKDETDHTAYTHFLFTYAALPGRIGRPIRHPRDRDRQGKPTAGRSGHRAIN